MHANPVRIVRQPVVSVIREIHKRLAEFNRRLNATVYQRLWIRDCQRVAAQNEVEGDAMQEYPGVAIAILDGTGVAATTAS